MNPQAEHSIRTGYLIVGAGLAGCTLGYLLRKAGAEVLALELYDAEKKDKLCAGAMGEGTLTLLTGIFGEDIHEVLHPVYIQGSRLRLRGREIRKRNTGGMVALPRKQLDDYALLRYLNAGGILLDRVSVKAVDAVKREAVGVGFWNSSPAFCKEILESFLQEISLDVDLRTLRGAFLPSGSDILLRAGENAYFVGDAAGLIHPTLGAGIHYALISAQCLAEALTAGTCYEDDMRPLTDGIARMAAKAGETQFIRNYSVYIKGEPAEPLFSSPVTV